jgi:hypothetical protein
MKGNPPIKYTTLQYKQKLSPHFTAGEFAPENNGDGTSVGYVLVSQYNVDMLEWLFSKVHQYFPQYEVTAVEINSGYRPHKNDGYHFSGYAVDFKVRGKGPGLIDGAYIPSEYVCATLELIGSSGIERINSRSVHTDARDAKDKWYATSNNGQPPYPRSPSGSWIAHYNLKPNMTPLAPAPTPAPPPKPAVKYFPTPKTAATLTAGLKLVGAKTTYAYRAKIAKANGLKGYAACSADNLTMAKLVKAGKLIKPGKKVTYYPQVLYTEDLIVPGLKLAGAKSSYAARKKIAAANGLTGYAACDADNKRMLALLKAGRLVMP